MVITLIGYRGSGKSCVAVPLASRLGWDWIDADGELERRAGRSIRDIFAIDGEDHFRVLEQKIISQLLARDKLVIAAGGGAILNEQTRREIKSAGPVVWLQASADAIERRLTADPMTIQRRPNLTTAGGRSEIEVLLAQRDPLYRGCATLAIKTDNLSIDEIVECILQSLDGVVRKES